MQRVTDIARLGWLLAPLLVAACATDRLDHAPVAADRPWQPQTTADGEILPGPPTAPADAPATFVLPTNDKLAVFPEAPAVDQAKLYDLADLIDLAQSNNPQTKIAWNNAREAALAAGIARSTYLPRISATALGAYQASDRRARVVGPSLDSDTSASGGAAVLSLQWLLFDFGERKAIVEGADQLTVAANIGFTAAHQKLIHEVSLAFYAYSDARDRESITDRSLEDAQAIVDAAEARFKGGIGTIIEVSQAKQAAAQARLSCVAAHGAVQDAYAELLRAMGMPPFARIAIADTAHHRLSAALGDDVERVVAAALGRRPDVLAAYAALKSREAGERAAKADFLPKVFVSGNGAYVGGDLSISGLPGIGTEQPSTYNLSNRRLGATILGGITIPLFDGGYRKAVLAQAQTRADSARLTLDQTRQDAAQQIVTANNQLATALAAHDAAEELRAAAQIAFDAALAAYRNQVGSSTEILLAERQLLEARILSSGAYHAALTAAATLALATGSLGAAPGSEGP